MEEKQIIGESLQHIYLTLRELKSINHARDNDDSILNVDLFPRKFLLKLINDRLAEVDELAIDLVSGLFKRLIAKSKKQLQSFEIASVEKQLNVGTTTSKCIELDKYFHCCLYYLHDFFIEFNWHESGLETILTDDDTYARQNLNYVRNFSLFQKALTDFNQQVNKLKTPAENQEQGRPDARQATKSNIEAPESSLASPKSAKSFKSSLSSTSKLNSPTRGRRVRFHDSPRKRNNGIATQNIDSLSIVSLDLLIYSLNLFVERLCNQLNNWYKSEASLKETLSIVRNSKQKLRTQQLETISKQIKNSNDIYLTVLDHLSDIRSIYLAEYVLATLCNGESRALSMYKGGRVRVFIQRIVAEIERKVIVRLVSQCLQLTLDLIINEINLPPLELESDKRNRSRENHFNFITSWLNVDDIVFGFATPKVNSNIGGKVKRVQPKDEPPPPPQSNKILSTLANSGPNFKSSSRILAQMDNLQELIQNLMSIIGERLTSQQQLAYFLDLLYAGFSDSFDTISRQISSQMTSIRRDVTIDELKNPGIEDINKNVDSIALKVRCLKFIHILTSVERLIKVTAAKGKVELSDDALERKLILFTKRCTQQTGSDYTK